MPEALYDELEQPRAEELARHLDECAACAALCGELRTTLETMSARRRPDPGQVFWDGYWRRLEERVARDTAAADASRFGRWRPAGSWGFRVAAAVAVLAGGVWIGRTILAPQPNGAAHDPASVVVAPPEQAEPQPQQLALDSQGGPPAGSEGRPIDAPAGEVRGDTGDSHDAGAGVVTAASYTSEAQRYIGRSQVVLFALLNGGTDEGEGAGFGSERAQARVLVAEGQRIQDDLTRPEDRRLRDLVGQLEMILREIANLEADSDLAAVEMIRNRVDREGVLLRIDLQQMREASGTDRKQGGQGKAFD